MAGEQATHGSASAGSQHSAAAAFLAGELRPGDVVLVKSSRDAGLRFLGDRLAAAGGAA